MVLNAATVLLVNNTFITGDEIHVKPSLSLSFRFLFTRFTNVTETDKNVLLSHLHVLSGGSSGW